VRFRETSASEPLMKCRKVQDDVETGGNSLTRDEPGGRPDYCPGGIRHEGGVTLNQAAVWNAGTCRPDVKGETQMGGPHEGENTEAGHRGGAIRSSVEGPVMGLERRDCIVQLWSEDNRRREDPRG
jgi:hypothetical protein